MKSVLRREALVLIKQARSITRQYTSLSFPVSERHPTEQTEISNKEFARLFKANPRWKMTYLPTKSEMFGFDCYYVEVPNQYAYESYTVSMPESA